MLMIVTVLRRHTVVNYCLAALVVLTLAGPVKISEGGEYIRTATKERNSEVWRVKEMMKRGCEELYVVKEGETLQSISDKCGDPFIVEHNPHIHDPDDVFPGLLIKLHINPKPFIAHL